MRRTYLHFRPLLQDIDVFCLIILVFCTQKMFYLYADKCKLLLNEPTLKQSQLNFISISSLSQSHKAALEQLCNIKFLHLT